jgi:transcriptional regulator with XRE-family HTH domain
LGQEYHAAIENLAIRIAKLRIEKGISAQKMSVAIGRSRGYIAQLERKHNLPSMNEFFYLCDFLGITPREFFDEEIESPAIYLELMNNIKKLDTEQLTNINGIVKALLK